MLSGISRIFISPHPDDIAFCCYASLINPPFSPADALIVTVFTQSKFTFDPQVTGGAGAEAVTRNRALEEQAFCSYVGCRLQSLGFKDSSLRHEEQGAEYRLSPEQDPILISVTEQLAALIGPAAKTCPVYVPLGVSRHLDHLIVREATRRVLQQAGADPRLLFYYEDLPYAANMSEEEIAAYATTVGPSLRPLLIDLHTSWPKKLAGLKIYRSQLEATTVAAIRQHAIRVGQGRKAERVWVSSWIESEPVTNRPRTLAWVTWEAVRQLGGVGIVLKNLLGDEQYQAEISRTLLIGPLYPPRNSDDYDPFEDVDEVVKRLNGDLLYCTNRKIQGSLPWEVTETFRQIERKHGIEIVYIRDRRQVGENHVVERLLINLSACVGLRHIYSPSLGLFLNRLKQELQLDLHHEDIRQHSPMLEALSTISAAMGVNFTDNPIYNNWCVSMLEKNQQTYAHYDNDFVHGILLAEPSAEALKAMLRKDEVCVVVVQDYFSLPVAYAALLNRRGDRVSADASQPELGLAKKFQRYRLRTLFYAGEMKTIRNLIEGVTSPAPNLEGAPMREVFARQLQSEAQVRTLIKVARSNRPRTTILDIPQLHHLWSSSDLRLIQQGWKLDRLLAVSDNILDELEFLDRNYNIFGSPPLFYHGNSFIWSDVDRKLRCRYQLLKHAAHAWGFDLDPDKCFLLTRITRPIICKSLHRDLMLLKFLGGLLEGSGYQALLLIITSWKDKQGAVVSDLLERAEIINSEAGCVRVRVINAANWPEQPEHGLRNSLLTNFSRDDLHRATDSALGLSSYESFGLAALEPLSCGAVCVLSSAVGAVRMLWRLREQAGASGDSELVRLALDRNILIADYVPPAAENVRQSLTSPLQMRAEDINSNERRVTEYVAQRLFAMLPKSDEERASLIESGAALSRQISWSRFIQEQFLPTLNELLKT